MVTVSEDRGNSVQPHTYSLYFVISVTNHSPQFTSKAPRGPAVVGIPFTYQVLAEDADGDKRGQTNHGPEITQSGNFFRNCATPAMVTSELSRERRFRTVNCRR